MLEGSSEDGTAAKDNGTFEGKTEGSPVAFVLIGSELSEEDRTGGASVVAASVGFLLTS